jgi:hypothetical protein
MSWRRDVQSRLVVRQPGRAVRLQLEAITDSSDFLPWNRVLFSPEHVLAFIAWIPSGTVFFNV